MRVALATAALLLIARVAAAQDLHGYADGSFFVSTQGSHTQGTAPDLPRSGVGGTTWGGAVGVGAFAGPRFSLGAELTLPARIEAIQETDYLLTFQNRNRYRDLTIAFVARLYTPAGHRVRAAAVGGFAIVQESVRQSTAYAQGAFPFTNKTFGPFGAETEYTRWAPGVTGGADVEISIGRHAAVVPQFRATWVSRSDDPSQPMWFLGLDSLVFRGAIGVRARF